MVTELAGAVLVAPSQPRSGLHNKFRPLTGEKKEKNSKVCKKAPPAATIPPSAEMISRPRCGHPSKRRRPEGIRQDTGIN